MISFVNHSIQIVALISNVRTVNTVTSSLAEYYPLRSGLSMEALTPRDQFLQSLDRCIENEKFIPAFYDRFLSTSDEIRDKFHHTDFEQQNKMLLRSLKLAAGATAGDPESLRELQERARTHDRNHLNIEAQHYNIWLESVIETVHEFDEEWSENVESTWRTILGYVISYMVKRY